MPRRAKTAGDEKKHNMIEDKGRRGLQARPDESMIAGVCGVLVFVIRFTHSPTI